MTGEPPTPTPDAPEPPARSGRTRIVVGVLMLVAAALVAIIGVTAWLLSTSTTGSNVRAFQNRPPHRVKWVSEGKCTVTGKTAPCGDRVAYLDGLVINATKSGFDLMLQDRRKVSLCVRKPDQPYIDIQHANTHAALGQPVRIYFQRIGDCDAVVYMEDSPLIF